MSAWPRRAFPVLLLLLALLGLVRRTARAHADLVEANPEPNAALDRSPAQIELIMSEPLEPSFSRIEVLDARGMRVDNDDSRLDASATRMTVSLRSLPDGVYTVSWQALSAVDSHVTAGAFPFAVGQVDPAALAAAGEAGSQTRLSLVEVLARWLTFGGAAVLVGGPVFASLVWGPARARAGVGRTAGRDERLGRICFAWPAVGALALGSLLSLLVLAGQATGTEIAVLWDPAVGQVLFTTRAGALWSGRLALISLLAWAAPGSPSPRHRWIGLAAGLLTLLSLSLVSHAAAEPQPLLPVAADWLHLLGAGLWLGGMIHLLAGLHRARDLPSPDRAAFHLDLLRRFSVLALFSVGAIALTGLYSALLRVGTLEALVGTWYGRTLVVKVALALGMLGLGAVNLLGLTPALRRMVTASRTAEKLLARFRGRVTAEVGLGLALLLSVALLTALPPAQTATTQPVWRETAQVEDLSLSLEITPGNVGRNTFSLRLMAGSEPVEDVVEVALRFTPTTAPLPPSEAILEARGEGVFAATGTYFSLSDTWQVQAVVRRLDRFDAFANFEVALGSAARSDAPWNRVSGLFLAAAAPFVVLAVRRHGALASLSGRLVSGLPALGLLALAVVSFATPTSRPSGVQVNPIPPNPESLAEGEDLYRRHCQSCHGAGGQGDGPVGVTLNPRPADLSLHTAPGVHPDAQLFEWISMGFEDSPMPAFQDALSEEERWHLVNFIRTFGFD